MKLLFVLEHYYPHRGGGETLFKLLTEKLASEGHECHVITCRLKGTKKYEKLNGVYIHRVKVPYWKDRYWFTFFAIPEVYKLAKKCDLIHTMTYNGALPTWLVSKILKKPSVITVYEILGPLWTKHMNKLVGEIHRMFEKIIVSLNFDKFIAISKYTKNSLIKIGVPSNKIKIIYCGVNYDLFNPRKASGKRIIEKYRLRKAFTYLFFGRPGLTKGLEYLIRAVPEITRLIPNSKLLLLLTSLKEGRSKYIRNLVNKMKIENNIIFLKQVPREELPDYLMAADCVVIPSISEGFSFTAAEACAMGRPVVASRAGALTEVVSGKYIFISPGDPNEITKAILMIKEGKYKKIKLKKFTLNDFYKGYKLLYKNILKKSMS